MALVGMYSGIYGRVETVVYQSDGYAAQLNDIGIGDGVEPADPGVEHSDKGRDDHCGVQRDL